MIMPVTHSSESCGAEKRPKTEEMGGSPGFENILSQISSTP